MALIICPYCGKSVSDKANRCIYCGTDLKEDDTCKGTQNKYAPCEDTYLIDENKEANIDKIVDTSVKEKSSNINDKKNMINKKVIFIVIAILFVVMIPVTHMIIKATTIDHIEIGYWGPVEAGVMIDNDNHYIAVKVVYKNGRADYVDDWTISNPGELETGKINSFTIGYEGVYDRLRFDLR